MLTRSKSSKNPQIANKIVDENSALLTSRSSPSYSKSDFKKRDSPSTIETSDARKQRILKERSKSAENCTNDSNSLMRRSKSTDADNSITKPRIKRVSSTGVTTNNIQLSTSPESRCSSKIIERNEKFVSITSKISKEASKIIKISEDEKSMNGAPEGDLYEMIVLQDNELNSFDDISQAEMELQKICSIDLKSLSWAEKYELIVVIRKISLFHGTILTNNNQAKSQVLNLVIETVSSLRSSTVKNGLCCLQSLLKNCEVAINLENSSQIVQSLLLRTSSGPKFICELASDLLNESVSIINPLLFIQSVMPYLNHRNAEITSRSFCLISKCIKQIKFEELQLDNEEVFYNNLADPVRSLSLGLKCKLAKGRESSKDGLKYLIKTIGRDVFFKIAEQYLPSPLVADLTRELGRVSLTGSPKKEGGSINTKVTTKTSSLFTRPAFNGANSKKVSSTFQTLKSSATTTVSANIGTFPGKNSTQNPTLKTRMLELRKAQLARATAINDVPILSVHSIPSYMEEILSVSSNEMIRIPSADIIHVPLFGNDEKMELNFDDNISASESTAIITPVLPTNVCVVKSITHSNLGNM
eukprot:gene10532-14149_t